MPETSDLPNRLGIGETTDDLLEYICGRTLWQEDEITLSGEDFDVLSGDVAPGYTDEDVLIRRKSDGALFHAEVDVILTEVEDQHVL